MVDEFYFIFLGLWLCFRVNENISRAEILGVCYMSLLFTINRLMPINNANKVQMRTRTGDTSKEQEYHEPQ